MSTTTKLVFLFGLFFLIYGYFCRFFDFYVFWDSKYFGWLGVISGLLLFLIDVRMARVRQKQNIFFVRIMVAVIVIFLALEGSAIVWLKTSNAYDEATGSIRSNQEIKDELGDVRGFSIIPGISIIDILNAPSSETLTFVITVRGERAYKEMEITIGRNGPVEWGVSSIKPI